MRAWTPPRTRARRANARTPSCSCTSPRTGKTSTSCRSCVTCGWRYPATANARSMPRSDSAATRW
ncbi:hypothetical protein ACFFX0_01465 [Citricoccus parietis]|uniref:Uncharacterized protein n=1 Tax=Citricoccus parietis TaxID=592307 RepID=A0ABV5FTB8_9MICC